MRSPSSPLSAQAAPGWGLAGRAQSWIGSQGQSPCLGMLSGATGPGPPELPGVALLRILLVSSQRKLHYQGDISQGEANRVLKTAHSVLLVLTLPHHREYREPTDTENGRQAVARTKDDQPTLRQVVGANLRILRQARDLSQEELGNEVEPYLGHRLTKQMVSLLEAGKRSLDLEELLAVYHVLLYPLDTMLRIGWKGTPLHDDDFIRLESGHSLPVRMVRGFIRGRQKGPESELLDVVIPPGEEDAEPLMALHELGGVRRLLAALGQMSDSERVELFGLAEQMDSGLEGGKKR
jgi:transcriptional regulator with XRE-family HTH domain